eukprot:TRINITY_DN42873_c0_g1_i1.p1 TRINITY_DN42873_c0_g1~~TRINITY_DN42873_c0_g1_i1.p1  ORF type:complete len:1187 (+),score=277.88 TRINITY_DN42873_c0_g1_i1:56-3616(+)
MPRAVKRRRAGSDSEDDDSVDPDTTSESPLSDGSESSADDDESDDESDDSDDDSDGSGGGRSKRKNSTLLEKTVVFDPYTTRRRRRFSISDARREERQPSSRAAQPSAPLDSAALVAHLTSKYPVASADKAAAPLPQPKGIVGCTLKKHQLAGLSWLRFLYDSTLGGILGDDMGVGKTLQVVGLLEGMRERGQLKLGRDPPVLVIAPLSTISGWMAEFEKRAPGITALPYIGAKDDREALRNKVVKHFRGHAPPSPFYHPHCQVIVTTAELLLNDDYFLAHFDYPLVVVDEAHRLKGVGGRFRHVLMAPKEDLGLGHVPRRLLLTGTALQNDVQELWSLLNIVSPEVFADRDAFCKRFNDPRGSPDQAAALRSVLARVMLRRTKPEVLSDLPPKFEYVLHCPLSPVQKQLYLWVLQREKKKLRGTGTGLHNIVMHLRKVCNHPYLFSGVEEEPFEWGEHIVLNAGKLSLLSRLLQSLKKQGRRVLLFSQFTSMLDILQDFLHLRGYEYERLDGSVRAEERFHAVSAFQGARNAASPFVFLLSTRAGGLGLNLTGADTVVLYDSDWNPHVDVQAQERVYRIGQTKTVLVYRLVCQGTVEDVILSRALKKLSLCKTLLDPRSAAESPDKVPAAELLDLIKAGLGAVVGGSESPPAGSSLRDLVVSKPSDLPPGEAAYKAFLTSEVGALLDRAMLVKETLSDKSSVSAAAAKGAHLVYQGEDYGELQRAGTRLKREGDPLERILGFSAVGPAPSRPRLPEGDTGAHADPVEPVDPVERAKEREVRRRDRMKKAWGTAGYVTRAIVSIPGFSDGASLLSDELGLKADGAGAEDDEDGVGEAREALNRVKGSAVSPDSCSQVAAALKRATGPIVHFIFVPVNNGGSWGSGGLFRSVDEASAAPRLQYELAGKCKDLRLGDLHLWPMDKRRCAAVAVVQRASTATHRSGGVCEAAYLDSALAKVADAADRLRARGARVAVHVPRFGDGREWYAVEKALTKHLQRDTFLYYFSRRLRAPDRKRRRRAEPASFALAGGVRVLDDDGDTAMVAAAECGSPAAAAAAAPAPADASAAATPSHPSTVAVGGTAAAPAAGPAAASALPCEEPLSGATAALVGDWAAADARRTERLLLLGGATVATADELAEAGAAGEKVVAVLRNAGDELPASLVDLRGRGSLRVATEPELTAEVLGV